MGKFRVSLPPDYAKPDPKTVKKLSGSRLYKDDAVVTLKITTKDDCERYEYELPVSEALAVFDAAVAQLEEISPAGEIARAKDGGELSSLRKAAQS